MRDYSKIPPIPSSVWKNPLHFVAFGFGSGAIPFAPGTFGTLIAIPFYLAIQSFTHLFYFITVLIITLGSMWICEKASRDIHIHDHPGMCLDEIVGYLVTMFAAPHGIRWIVIGFLLFRLFDIWKPWPISTIDERIAGGVGMILDDILAGVYSFLVLQLLTWII